MPKFTYEDFEVDEPRYFYRVREYVSTMGKDPGKNEPIELTQDFGGYDLLQCRAEAIQWYNERGRGIEKRGGYFLPFASPQNFVMGKNALFSIDLYFVEYYDDDNYTEYNLLGDSESEIEESRELERFALARKGLL